MKNIIIINYLAIAYSIIVGAISYFFFSDFYLWVILGAATALFNHSLLVRFTKNTMTKDILYLLIIFKFMIYLIILGFMFFLLRENSMILSKSYIFFLIGAINIKVSIIIFHLPIPKFQQLRLDEKVLKEEEEVDPDIY